MTTIDGARPITYDDGVTPVEIGDWVSLRVLFRRRTGRVVYLPGVSKLHGEFEFGGLTWVGIDIPKGPVVKAVVDPDGRRLQKNIRFVRHDAKDASELDSSTELS